MIKGSKLTEKIAILTGYRKVKSSIELDKNSSLT